MGSPFSPNRICPDASQSPQVGATLVDALDVEELRGELQRGGVDGSASADLASIACGTVWPVRRMASRRLNQAGA